MYIFFLKITYNYFICYLLKGIEKLNDKENYVYKDFDDWFQEIQSFSLRAEYFLDDLENKMDAKTAISWLKACWESAREKNN